MHALLFDYTLGNGTTPAEDAELCEELAPAVGAVRGLVSMTWLANDASGRYGGFCIFESRETFNRFVASELFATFRDRSGVGDFVAAEYGVNARATLLPGRLPKAADAS